MPRCTVPGKHVVTRSAIGVAKKVVRGIDPCHLPGEAGRLLGVSGMVGVELPGELAPATLDCSVACGHGNAEDTVRVSVERRLRHRPKRSETGARAHGRRLWRSRLARRVPGRRPAKVEVPPGAARVRTASRPGVVARPFPQRGSTAFGLPGRAPGSGRRGPSRGRSRLARGTDRRWRAHRTATGSCARCGWTESGGAPARAPPPRGAS